MSDARLQHMRFVEVRGMRYLRADDVAAFIRELGVTEEVDVRSRLEQAARNLNTTSKARL